MTNTNKPIRLSKAAREFNVSTGTIVVYLNKKGYDISSNPNTKLTSEMYQLLLKEYSKEKTVKEEAKRHSLKYSKRKSVSLEDEQKAKEEEEGLFEDEEPEEDEDMEEDTVFIKNSSSWATPAPAKEKQEEPEAEKSPEPKADEKPEAEKEPAIQEEKPAAKEEKQKDAGPEKPATPDKKIEEPKAEAKPEAADEAKKEEKPATEEQDKGGLKVLGKIDVDNIEKGKPKKKTPKPEKEEPKAKEQPSAEQKPEAKPAKPKQTAKPDDKIKKAEKKSAKKETLGETEQPVAKKEDIPAKEEKKKDAAPEKKTQKPSKKKADKQEGPAAKESQEKPNEETEESAEKASEKKDDFIETKVERLNGPKILGTIDLPSNPKKTEKKRPDKRKDKAKKPADKKAPETGAKKKPVASSADDSVRPKKKKRRRIPTGNEQRDDSQNKPRQRHGSKKPGKKVQPARKRQEPSEEEVQKQVKETLARLSGGGGKSKTSKHRRTKRETARVQHEAESQQQEKKVIQATEFVTVNELASMMEANVNQVISTCMSLGLFVSINQRLDAETITMVADEFGYEVEFVSVEVQEALESSDQEEQYDDSDLEERAPIVTVMGHVDHGKTSLLDFIRKTNVIGGEAGGITQHIGAYEVKTQSGKSITFLDTPGHEAFTAMRARGAQVTDVAIIVIAADDKIMPQTIEAINHAQAAGVPTVFAINKIDKPGARPDKIKEELSQRNILVEEWGGKYQSHDISAKHGKGIDELLEKVMLEAEMLELKSNPKKHAKGTVVESALDRGRGYIAKLLVQEGTLKKGDYVLAGSHSGKVKAMYNERNQIVESAGPSVPVLMLGLDGAPQAGDQFNVLEDEREAKDIAVKRRQLQREQGIRTQKHVTLDEIGRRIAIGDFKELNIIVKGDVDGSVEALADSLLKLSTDEVQLNVIHKSVGQISESDVMLASASDAIIVGFQVRPSVAARRLAEKEQIDIRAYSVIYKAIEEIRAAIEGMLSPDIEEKIVCNLEVRDIFKITKVGTIAGCMVLDGVITRNTRVRVIRDGIVVYTGNLGSLKRYKDDVKEVKAGYECGLNIENFNDIKVGDIIEGFEEVEVARKL